MQTPVPAPPVASTATAAPGAQVPVDDGADGTTAALPAAGTPPTSGAAPRLDSQLVRAIAWTGAGRWLGQIVRWGSTLVIARILVPADYGLVGMSTYLVGLMQILSEFGLSATILRMRDLPERTVRQLNTHALFVGLGSFAVVAAAAPLVARFFGEPRLVQIVPVAAIGFVLSSLLTVPNALLQRNLRFKRIVLADTIGALALALTTLTLAILGWRHWALVTGPLVATALSMLLQRYAQPVRFAWPRYAELRDTLAFTRQVLVSRIAWYLYSTSDMLVVGRVLGPASLGAYSVAWSLAFVPVEQTNTIVSRVSPAFLSAVQKDPAQARRFFLSLTEAIATITMPAAIGLAAVAPAFVATVLGANWTSAVTPLALGSCFAAFRCLTLLYGPVLVQLGDARANMRIALTALAVLPVTFYLAARWGGVAAVAVAWSVFFPVAGYPQFRRVQRVLSLPGREYLAAIVPSLVGCAVMAAAVLGVGAAVGSRLPAPALLVVQVLTGAATFVATMFLAFRERVARLRTVVHTLRGR